MVCDLLFSGGGVDDLNVDNIDRPLRLPNANAPILSSYFFALASPGHAERSPSSVHRAGSSGKGGTSKIERHILTICLPTGSASKGADAVSGRAAEPVALVEGGAVEAVVPDTDEGSGSNSLVGQHVPTSGDHRTIVGEAPPSVFYLPPLASYFSTFSSQCRLREKVLEGVLLKYLTRIFSSFRDGFIEGMDALSNPNDLNHLLDLCGNLKQSLKTFGAKLVGLLALMRLLTRLFLNLEQEVKQLTASVEEDESEYHLVLEAKNQLIKERDAKVAFINATKVHLAQIDAELPSCQKAMEVRGAILLIHSARLKEAEHHLLSALSEMERMREVEIAPPGLALVSGALVTLRAASKDGFPFP
ncbi:hypothetical protein ACLOJK_037409 [Asimina triloba]